MKVLITGATGHLGRSTVHTLSKAGYLVVAASRSGKQPELPFGASAEGLGERRSIALDIDHDSSIPLLEAELGPDTALVHLAAWHPPSTASTTSADRRKLLESNVYGTMRVLDAVRRARKQKGEGATVVVYASTFEVYGEIESPGEIDEQSRLNPITDYGATKLSGEDHLFAFAYEEKTRAVALRMPAVYGPGETTPRALPNFLRQAAQGKRPTLYGDGLDQRDQLHVRDAAHAILRALQSQAHGIYNIADGQPHTIAELASLSLELAGQTGEPEYLPRQKARRDYHMSIQKARRELLFEPQVQLKDGMHEQMSWLLGQSPC